jgi:ABC-type oligopeptide transport system ATPase subunit
MPNLQKEKKQELLKVLETLGNKEPLAYTHDNVYLFNQQRQIIKILRELIYETL